MFYGMTFLLMKIFSREVELLILYYDNLVLKFDYVICE